MQKKKKDVIIMTAWKALKEKGEYEGYMYCMRWE